MRELTLEEVELVAGGLETSDGGSDGDGDGGDGDGGDQGGDGGDVVVTGNPPSDDSDDGDDGGDDTDFGDDPGDGDQGDVVVTASNHPHSPTPSDMHIDCVASHLAQEIAAKSNSDRHEYSSVVYVSPDGSVHAGKVLDNGQSGGKNFSNADYGVPNDGSVVIASVHNHPTLTEQYPGGPAYPSSNPEQSSTPSYLDMKNLDTYHNDLEKSTIQNLPFDPNDARLYLEYNGVVKEYDWKDQDMSNLNGTNKTTAKDWAKPSDYEPACGG